MPASCLSRGPPQPRETRLLRGPLLTLRTAKRTTRAWGASKCTNTRQPSPPRHQRPSLHTWVRSTSGAAGTPPVGGQASIPRGQQVTEQAAVRVLPPHPRSWLSSLTPITFPVALDFLMLLPWAPAPGPHFPNLGGLSQRSWGQQLGKCGSARCRLWGPG